MIDRMKQPKLSRKELLRLDRQSLTEMIPGRKLGLGAHEAPSEGACVMEAVAWVSGEPFSDHPRCADLAITNIAIEINDNVNDRLRQELLDAVPAITGSKTKSGRVRFNRVRVTAAFVLQSVSMVLGKIISQYTRKGFKPSRLVSLAIQDLREIADGSWPFSGYTRRVRLLDVIELIEHIVDSTCVCVPAEVTNSLSFIKRVAAMMERCGSKRSIEEDEYLEIMDRDIIYMLPQKDLPIFIAQVAMTRD